MKGCKRIVLVARFSDETTSDWSFVFQIDWCGFCRRVTSPTPTVICEKEESKLLTYKALYVIKKLLYCLFDRAFFIMDAILTIY